MLENLPDAIGEALESVRAGLTHTIFHSVDLQQGMGAMVLASLAFADHAPIPTRYTADGDGLSPPLHWHGVPPSATEVVLIVEDADSPTPQPFVHAVVHGLPPRSSTAHETRHAITDAETTAPLRTAAEEPEPGDGALAEGLMGGAHDTVPLVSMGRNSLLQTHWLPPDPPPGHGVHRYVFQLFALGPGAALPESPGRDALRHALLERGLASACLIGTFERPSGAITDAAPVAPSPGLAAG